MQNVIQRGIISAVRAQAPAEIDVPGLVAGLSDSFTAFKAKYDDRVDGLQKAVDDLAVRDAAAELGGAVGPEKKGGADIGAPSVGVPSMRSYKQFKAHYSKGEPQDAVSVTDFLRGVSGMSATPAVRAALNVGQNTAGGFSVPSATMPAILSALTPASALLTAGAGIVPLEAGAKSATTAIVDTVPTASWRAESGNVAESDPAFRGVVSVPQSLAFFFKISRELLADGLGIEAALQTAIAQAFAKELDRAGLRGSGTAPEPRGLLNMVGVNAITNGANGAALAGYSNMFAGVQAILQANAPLPTAAIMSPRSMVKLGGLVDNTGQPLRTPTMLENVRMIATSQIPNNLTVGTSSDCTELYLGDFSKMYFLMRENLSIQLLRESFATTGEIGFLCHSRADVVVTHPKAFAVVTGVRA
jgi:HK97 family phage major capsid protein